MLGLTVCAHSILHLIIRWKMQERREYVLHMAELCQYGTRQVRLLVGKERMFVLVRFRALNVTRVLLSVPRLTTNGYSVLFTLTEATVRRGSK